MQHEKLIADISRLSANEFELLCHEIVRVQNPDAKKLAPPDGGCDSIIAEKDASIRIGWQAKSFERSLKWSECEKSIRRAAAEFNPDEFEFLFSKVLTAGQFKTFHSRLVRLGTELGITVDYRDAEWIAATLAQPGYELIVDKYFKPAISDGAMRVMELALRAGGPLWGPSDVVDRGLAIAKHLSTLDPKYSYTMSHGRELPEFGSNACLRMVTGDDELRVVIDAIAEPGAVQIGEEPRFNVHFDDPAAAKTTAKLINRVMELGGRIELSDGIRVEHDRLPVLFDALARKHDAEDHGRKQSLQIHVKPTLNPVYGRLEIESTDGKISVDIDLVPDKPTDDWDAALKGSAACGCFELQVNLAGPHNDEPPAIGFNYTYKHLDAPAAEHALATNVMSKFAGEGKFRIVDRRNGGTVFSNVLQPDPQYARELSELNRVYEALSLIERRAGKRLLWPLDATDEEVNHVLRVAKCLEQGFVPLVYSSVVLETTRERFEEIPDRESHDVVIDETYRESIFGEHLALGQMRVCLENCKIEQTIKPVAGSTVRVKLRITPAAEKSQRVRGMLRGDELPEQAAA